MTKQAKSQWKQALSVFSAKPARISQSISFAHTIYQSIIFDNAFTNSCTIISKGVLVFICHSLYIFSHKHKVIQVTCVTISLLVATHIRMHMCTCNVVINQCYVCSWLVRSPTYVILEWLTQNNDVTESGFSLSSYPKIWQFSADVQSHVTVT